MSRPLADAFRLHLLFGLLLAPLVLLLTPPLSGLALLGWVVAYHLALPLQSLRRRHDENFQIWRFLLPLSMFQVMPDWVLAQLLGVLVFPDLGAPRIGAVPLYMGGLWAVPLFWVVLLAGRSGLLGALLALLIFGLAEWAARPTQIWYARDVQQVQGVALYVLPAEALLGWATVQAYQWQRQAGWLTGVALAAAVSIFYTGALVVSLFVLERLL